MDLRDVGMPQPRQQVRLLLEASHHGAAGKAVAQDLDRNRASGRPLEALVDAAHAPFGQHTDDRHAAQVAPGHQIDDVLPFEAK